MPHKGRKRFQNKEKNVINFTKKKRKKLMLAQKKGRLIIKNLSFKTTEQSLREYLNKFGDVCEVKFLRKADGNLVGRGFVQFTKEQSAVEAIQNCNGKDFMGRKIVVDWAVQKADNENIVKTVTGKKGSKELVECKKDESESEEESTNEDKEEKHEGIMKATVVQNVNIKERKKNKNARKGRLIVRNLPFKITEAILRKHFAKYGEITETTLLRKADGKLVGCGFIQFIKKNSAAKAILACSGKPLLGRTIIVDWAVPKSTFSTKNESSNKEEVEMKDEPNDEDVIVVKSTSATDDSIHPVEVKKEQLSDESEETDDSDKNSEASEDSSSNDEEDEDNSDEEAEKKTDIKKPRIVSHDVSEGRTVFLKNVPFSVKNEDLKTCMEQFGKVIYALVCMDAITEHSKGTAFVKFQTKESAEKCLSAGTELTLHDQTLDVFTALNKEELQNKADRKNEAQKTKDSRNLYLVKEGVVLAGSRAAAGVSMTDMTKRLQLEQWKSQMLRNLNMFVSRVRLVVHNLPSTWNDAKLRELFLRHAGPKGVIKEARVMRDMRNVDAQGIGKSKEFGFVCFAAHEHALQALRNINNNPDIFTTAKRPVVAFSIENKAIMNIKQKRLERSLAKNSYHGKNDVKRRNEASKLSKNHVNSAQQRIDVRSSAEENKEEYVGVTAKPGNKKLRTRFGIKSQAKIHSQSLRKVKHKKKMERKIDQQMQNKKEKMKEPQQKKGVKRKLDEDEVVFNKLVSKYKNKLKAAPLKKWYDE